MYHELQSSREGKGHEGFGRVWEADAELPEYAFDTDSNTKFIQKKAAG